MTYRSLFLEVPSVRKLDFLCNCTVILFRPFLRQGSKKELEDENTRLKDLIQIHEQKFKDLESKVNLIEVNQLPTSLITKDERLVLFLMSTSMITFN